MKKFFVPLLIVILLLAAAFTAYADEEEQTVPAEAAIGDFAVSASMLDSNRVSLKWNKPEVTVTEGYSIDRIEYHVLKKTGDGEYKDIYTTDSLKYTDPSLSAEKVYRYKVECIVTVGGLEFTKKSAATDKLYYLKSVGKPKSLKLSQVKNKSTIKVTWKAGKNASKYRVYRKKKNKWVLVKETSKLTYTDKDAQFYKTYRYRVRAFRTFKGKKSLSGYTKVKKATVKEPRVLKMKVNNINQYAIGYSMGCEIVALAVVMRHMGFTPKGGKAMTDKLYNKYTTKGDYDLNKAYYGNPKGNGNSFGACYERVIRNTANKFLKDKDPNYKAKALKGKSVETLFKQLVKGRPVIVWATEKMKIGYRYKISGGWWYRYSHTMVLTGYNKDKGIVYITDPERGRVSYSIKKFKKSYEVRGKRAVVIMPK